MRVKKWMLWAALACAATAWLGWPNSQKTAWAADKPADNGAPAAPSASRCKENANGDTVCPWDKGPDTIDVSSYPPEMQKIYEKFSYKCSKCHTLARPINSDYAMPEEWQAYVTKMQHKKRSGVDADSAKQIIQFLTYDSSVRKKGLIAEKENLIKERKFKTKADDGGAPAAKDSKPGEAKKDEAAKPNKEDQKAKSGD